MKVDGMDTSRSWVMASVCCLVFGLISGTARLSSILFVESIIRYDTDRKAASLPFTVCFAVRNIIGPLVGYAGRKFGLQKVTVMGCFVSSVAVASCFFAEDIVAVTVSWGVLFGAGFGISTILLPEIMTLHFDKHITKANGLYLAGGCFGAFVLPVVFDVLLKEYGVSGALLIYSSIILHSVPVAMLLDTSNAKGNVTSVRCKENNKTESVIIFDIIPPKVFTVNATTDTEISFKTQTSALSGICIKCSIPLNKSKNRTESSGSEFMAMNINSEENKKSFICTVDLIGGTKSQAAEKEANIRKIRCSDCMLPDRNNIAICDQKNADQKVVTSGGHSLYPEEKNHVISSFHVFGDPAFLLILLSQSSFLFIVTLVWTVVIDFSKDIGVCSSEEIHVLLILSMSDTIGRFCLGWIVDGGYLTTTKFCGFSFLGYGISCILFVLSTGFAMVMVAVSFFGLLTGALFIIFPRVVCENIEKKHLTMALASRYVLHPPLSFVTAPLIGYFRGTLHSYYGIFYILALHCLVCSVLVFLTPAAAKYRIKKQMQKLDEGKSVY